MWDLADPVVFGGRLGRAPPFGASEEKVLKLEILARIPQDDQVGRVPRFHSGQPERQLVIERLTNTRRAGNGKTAVIRFQDTDVVGTGLD